MGDNPLIATQSLLLPGPDAEEARGQLLALPSPSNHNAPRGSRRGHVPTDLSHAGLNWSKSRCKFSGKWETSWIWGQLILRQMQNKQRGCLHEQHAQLIYPGVLSSLSSQLWEATPTVKAKKLNLWTAEVSSIHKITGVLYLFNADISLPCVRRQIEHDRPSHGLQLKALRAYIGKRCTGINHSHLSAVYTHRLALHRLHNVRIKVSRVSYVKKSS